MQCLTNDRSSQTASTKEQKEFLFKISHQRIILIMKIIGYQMKMNLHHQYNRYKQVSHYNGKEAQALAKVP